MMLIWEVNEYITSHKKKRALMKVMNWICRIENNDEIRV